jgi:signal transduction histidine kinase
MTRVTGTRAVAAAGVLILVLDPISLVPTMLHHTYDGAMGSLASEVYWWPNSVALVVIAVVLARSGLPLIHAWTCLAWQAVNTFANLSSSGYFGTWLPLVAVPVAWMDSAVVAALVLRFPRARLRPGHRAWVVTLLILVPAAQLLQWWAQDPFLYLTGQPVWWRQLPVPDAIFRSWIYPGTQLVTVAAAIGTVVLAALRYRSSRGPTRDATLALLGAVGFFAVMTATSLAGWIPEVTWNVDWSFYNSWPAWYNMLNLALGFAPGVMAVALLAALLRYRSAVATTAVRILAAAGPDRRPALTEALRSAFGDPSATVTDRSATGTGTPAVRSIAPGRRNVAVRGTDGTVLAVLDVDEAVVDVDDPAYVAGILDVLRMGLENERLRDDQMRYADRVLASRAHAVEAALAERHRLERNLHDGVQQAMLGLSAMLSRTALVEGPAPLADLVFQAERLAGAVLGDVDRLCEGLRPSALDRAGLASALPALASTAALEVRLDIGEPGTAETVPSTVESVTYYVVAEALANAVKHAAAARAVVMLVRSDSALTVCVDDDGVGGARLVPGGGLAGLADRVAMAGGRLDVETRPEGGTRVRAALPCPR